jgi:hypothetical protein
LLLFGAFLAIHVVVIALAAPGLPGARLLATLLLAGAAFAAALILLAGLIPLAALLASLTALLTSLTALSSLLAALSSLLAALASTLVLLTLLRFRLWGITLHV